MKTKIVRSILTVCRTRKEKSMKHLSELCEHLRDSWMEKEKRVPHTNLCMSGLPRLAVVKYLLAPHGVQQSEANHKGRE